MRHLVFLLKQRGMMNPSYRGPNRDVIPLAPFGESLRSFVDVLSRRSANGFDCGPCLRVHFSHDQRHFIPLGLLMHEHFHTEKAPAKGYGVIPVRLFVSVLLPATLALNMRHVVTRQFTGESERYA